MRIPAAWMIAGAIAIGLTSCGEEETANVPNPSVSPSAAESSASPSPSDPKAQTFSQPLVAGKGGKDGKDKKVATKSLSVISGLTKSTDPDEQARKAQAEINSTKATRSDPFTSLPPLIAFKTPKVESSMPVDPSGSSNGGSTPIGRNSAGSGVNVGRSAEKAPTPSNMPEMPKFPDVIRPKPIARQKTASRPLASIPLNGRPGVPGGIPIMPPIPQPTLAREVEVTGVVTIGRSTQAIVRAPGEPSSRYVSAGQRLANGQVLVKRIEMNPGSDPVVILEENGMEVSIMVGSKKTAKP
jgi:hypothetical protein